MVCVPSAELLEQWTSDQRSLAGEQICIRPLCPDDREREIAFINSLSERSRYFRLFTPLKSLPPHLLDQLMDLDYDRRIAFVASTRRDGREEFIGIARYGQAEHADAAELGITVADAWQRRGVARLLLMQLMRFAYSRGVRKLTGMVLPDNHPMLALARALGFEVHFDSTQHLFVISRDLNGAGRTHLP
jgi:RimJ/RimL family protein N-acetyltransferase